MAITIDGTNGLSSDNAALKLDGTTLAVDETNNRVGVGTASPAVAMDVVGQVRASTGILFGSDTAAANALDDYEQGTFTPIYILGITSPTYSTQEGKYTKIGNLVMFSLRIEASGGTRTANILEVAGLPFISVASGPHSGAWFAYSSTIISSTSTNLPTLYLGNGTTKIQFYKTDGAAFLGNDMNAVTANNYIVGQYFTE